MSFLFSQPAPGILPANSVDFSEVETIASNTLLGNNTGSDSVILELSKTQATAMLDVMGVASAGSGGLKGLVPASSAGDQTKFLRADATWNTIDLSGLQPLDSDLTAIAGLTPADDDIIQRKSGSWTNRTPAQFKTDLSLTKSDVGLSNVDNTSDANKPISTATQLALNAKVDSVSGSSPISSSGGTTPTISISDFGGATSLLPGSRGSVPAPAAGDQAKFLRGDASWATVDPLPSQTGNQNKVLVTSGSAASWQYAGLGDGNFGTNDVIVGRDKPAGFTGTGTVIVGSGAGTNAATNSVLIGYLADGYTESISIGKSSFTGNYGLAIGIGSFAGNYGIGIGHTANGSGSGIAIGQNASANSNCLAIGISASSTTGVAIGGSSSCSGTDSTAVGVGSTASGQFTTAIGAYTTTAAIRSVAVGYGAGYTSTNTASYSTFVGMFAGKGGVSGANNTLIGYQSGSSLISGYSNVFIGSNSGSGISAGTDNVCIGTISTLPSTLAGAVCIGTASSVSNNCVAIGNSATASGTETVSLGVASYAKGSGTTTLGAYAGNSGDSGTYCVYIGYGAGYSSAKSGNDVTAVGMWSGKDLTSGANNSLFGKSSGKSLTTGSGNLFLGYTAGDAVTTGSNNVIIGDIAGTTTLADTIILAAGTNERIRVDSSGNVGIGTTSPGEKLEVSGNVKVSSGDLSIATAGKGLAIKSGSNAKIGVTGAFPGGGTNTVTVSTTAVTTNSIIFISAVSGATTVDPKIWVSTITANTSFVINSGDNSFTGTVGWMIVEATP